VARECVSSAKLAAMIVVSPGFVCPCFPVAKYRPNQPLIVHVHLVAQWLPSQPFPHARAVAYLFADSIKAYQWGQPLSVRLRACAQWLPGKPFSWAYLVSPEYLASRVELGDGVALERRRRFPSSPSPYIISVSSPSVHFVS
jgi:hypothetical protein